MWLPAQQAVAVKDSVTGLYTIKFDLDNTRRLMRRLAIVGPEFSTLQIFVGAYFVDNTSRGDLNAADWPEGVPVPSGSEIKLVWSVGTGTPVPSAMLFCTDDPDKEFL